MVKEVAVTLSMEVAAAPPTVTPVIAEAPPAKKPVPVTVTNVPPAFDPDAGERAEMVGVAK